MVNAAEAVVYGGLELKSIVKASLQTYSGTTIGIIPQYGSRSKPTLTEPQTRKNI